MNKLLPIFLIILLGGLFPAAVAQQPYYRLTVDAAPADSKIRIMNIKPKYRPGMALAPGKYNIYVTREGYKAKRGWVTLKSDLIVEVILNKRTDVQYQASAHTEPKTVVKVHPSNASKQKPMSPKRPDAQTVSQQAVTGTKPTQVIETKSYFWIYVILGVIGILLLVALGLAVWKREQVMEFVRSAQENWFTNVVTLSSGKAVAFLAKTEDDEKKELVISKLLSKPTHFQVNLLTELERLESPLFTDGTFDVFFGEESFTTVVLAKPAKAANFLNQVLKRIGCKKAVSLLSSQPENFQAETLKELEKLNANFFMDGTLDCLLDKDMFTNIVWANPVKAATFLEGLLKRYHCQKAVSLLQTKPKDFQIATLKELDKLNPKVFSDGTLDCLFGDELLGKVVFSEPAKAAHFLNEVLERQFTKKADCQDLVSLLQSTANDFQKDTLIEFEKLNPKSFTNGKLDCLFGDNVFAEVVLATPFKAALFLNEVLDRTDCQKAANVLKSKPKEFQVRTLQELEELNSKWFLNGKLDCIFYDEELLTDVVLSNSFTAAYFLNRVILNSPKALLEQIIGKLKSKTKGFQENVLQKLDKLLNLGYSRSLSNTKNGATFLRWYDFESRSYGIVEILFSGGYQYDCESAYEYVSMTTPLTAAHFLSKTLLPEKIVDGEVVTTQECHVCYGEGVASAKAKTNICVSCDGTGKEKIVQPKYRYEFSENTLVEGANKLKQRDEDFQTETLTELEPINSELAEGLNKLFE